MPDLLKKLNEFTRRDHTEDEVYIFDLILCDNDIDRDFECFSDEALKALQKMFIGKTGIFDHNAKGTNQTARIFQTELITDTSRKTQTGKPYTYLKACAYMVRTAANTDLIKEIDAGIKKEVSISCACSKNICSICGNDKKKKACSHVKGKTYNGKPCFVILDDVTDAYEWSFVAVPAQVNAGVTKYFNGAAADEKAIQIEMNSMQKKLDILTENLKADIIKLSSINKSAEFSTIVNSYVENLDADQLIDLKKSLERSCKGTVKSQLCPNQNDSLACFKI
jgi:hypothetical protein